MLFLAQQEVVLLEIGHDARFPHSVNLYAFAMSNSIAVAVAVIIIIIIIAMTMFMVLSS